MAARGNESSATGDLAKAGTIQGSALAEQARTRLDAAGISATLQADPEATQGVGLGLLGDINVMVPASQLEQAQRIIREVSHEANLPLAEEGGDRN